MSPIASALSPSRTAAIPELISGNALAVARIAAPKMTPLSVAGPACCPGMVTSSAGLAARG
jgi:hypothetical protein